MRRILIPLLITLFYLAGKGQTFQQIPHCPSKEVYDILVDKKGFIWVAHSLGISRYDGISFTNFTNPNQSAVSMTGLLEDNYGRIWFHNFNGQVFYIQNEKMEYLEEYDFRNTVNYPNIVLLQDELIITSFKGVFICNTRTMKCRTVSPIDPTWQATFYVKALSGKALATSPHDWWIYTPAKGLEIIPPQKLHFDYRHLGSNTIFKHSSGDTVFLFDQAKGIVHGIVNRGGDFFEVITKNVGAYINTMSEADNKKWINTNSGSVSLYGYDSMPGRNLTSMAIDKLGNAWAGSLTDGLLVKYQATDWQPQPLNNRYGQTNLLRTITVTGNGLMVTSNDGGIWQKVGYKTVFEKVMSLPKITGRVEDVQIIDSANYFISTSKVLYLINSITKQTKLIDSNSVKALFFAGQNLYLGTAFGVAVKFIPENILINPNAKSYKFSVIQDSLFNSGKDFILKKYIRCRAMQYDTLTNSLLIAFTDGLQRLQNSKLTFITYEGKPIYVSSMASYHNKIYAATFNNGLMLINGNKAFKIKKDNESPLDAIVKIKCCNNHLWIFRAQEIEVLNTETDTFIQLPDLPVDAAEIFDVAEDGNEIYLVTQRGLFKTPALLKGDMIKEKINFLYALINNKDSISKPGLTLKSDQNNILFRLAIPIYNNADKIHFKYSLTNNGDDTAWYYTQDAQRDIQFNALKAGDYVFTAIAVKDNEIVSRLPLVYHFTISPPWYNTITFYILAGLAIIAITIGVQQYRLRQVLKIERVRRRISNDLHDDIGSTLSSINIYSQLAKTETDNKEYIDTIQESTVSIIGNLDDLVWNINPKNDVLENLVARMRQFAEPLLAEKDMECVFTTDIQDMQTIISPECRTNLYLLFKEAVNNVVKHSAAKKCTITITQKSRQLLLEIADDGRGFDSKVINRHRNGLHSIQQRVTDLRGMVQINSQPGKGASIVVTCQLK